jgi:flavin reductase (DIM6/NTAB) family NADH-FMN oxidoreductase RutF
VKRKIPLSIANRLINPGCVVLVTTSLNGRPNIITIAWQMPVSHVPPLVAISVAHTHYTHEVLHQTGEFVINVPNKDLLQEVLLCGKVSGRDVDKFMESGLTPAQAKKTSPPYIKECIGHLECRVAKTIDAGDHTIFIGEVLHAECKEDLFEETWKVRESNAKTLLHLGGRVFAITEPYNK